MKEELFKNLEKAMYDYDKEKAKEIALKIVEENINTVEAVDVLSSSIATIGDKFSSGELWLPDLMLAADTMKGALAILEKELLNQGIERKSQGKIVLGTVYGDIHNIGKNMVGTLFSAAGFEVIDLGENVESKDFIEAVKKNKPDVLAMSALLTTTAPEQKRVIEGMIKEGIRKNVKIIVGGGCVTQEFSDLIGADGFEPTAPLAVDLVKRLLNK